MSIRKVSVAKSTDPTDTKWQYSCVRREWGVSVRFRSVRSVRCVQRGLQGKVGLVCKCVAWLQMRRKKRHKSPFFSTKKTGKIQPPDFQSLSVLHPIRIIQHPTEMICFKWWVTHLWLQWYDRSNSSGMYIGFKSVLNLVHVLNWGQQTFRH